MANITQLQITGSSTIHNLNDARISATAVTTATHVLTANSGVTSIAPIAVADLASVLGAFTIPTAITPVSGFSFNSAAINKVYFFSNSGTSDFGTSDCPQDSPSGSYSLLETWGYANWFKVQRFTIFGGYIYVRFYMSNAWKPWKKFTAS